MPAHEQLAQDGQKRRGAWHEGQKARVIGAEGKGGDLLLELGQYRAQVAPVLRRRPAQQRLHVGTRGGSAEGLFGKRGLVAHDPGEGLLSEGLHLFGVGVRQRRCAAGGAGRSTAWRQSWWALR